MKEILTYIYITKYLEKYGIMKKKKYRKYKSRMTTLYPKETS